MATAARPTTERPENVREGKPSHRFAGAGADASPDESRLVAQPAGPAGPPPARPAAEPDRRGLRLLGGVQDPRPRSAEARHPRGDDDLAGLVARRLRPLRPAVHPDDLARRRDLPDPRRPRWRWHRRAALRPAQQLA